MILLRIIKKTADYFISLYFRMKIKRGVYVLERLDEWMQDAGYKRHERRQFWREFVSKQGARDKLFERMAP